MGVEAAGRDAADLVGPFLQESSVVLIIDIHVRAGEVHAICGTTGRLGERIREQTVSAHQHGILEAGNFFGLGGHQWTFRLEDREVNDLRSAGGNRGEDRLHVGIAHIHSFLGCNRSTELGKDFGEHTLQGFGVGAAIVDGGGGAQAQLVVGEFSRNSALEQVVVSGAVITRMMIGVVGIGQVRVSVRGGNHHHASL